MKPKRTFKPQHVRGILTVFLFLVLIGGGTLFYKGLQMVKQYSADVDIAIQQAEASDAKIESMQALKNQLANSSVLLQKAGQLSTTPGHYQIQMNNDISRYASAVGISIERTSFENSSNHEITVQLEKPVSYNKLIAFLNNIEGNIPKLRVTSISLQHDPTGSTDSVIANEIKIKALVR